MKNIKYSIIGVVLLTVMTAIIVGAIFMVYNKVLMSNINAQYKKADNYAAMADSAPKDGIVFLGDSITEMYRLDKFYKQEQYINRGISSNTTGRILERLDSNVLKLQPSTIVYLAGVNDIGYQIPTEETLRNMYNTFLAIHEALPETNILVQSVYPTVELDNINSKNLMKYRTNSAISALNEKIRTMTEALQSDKGINIKYIDMYSVLIDESTGNLNIFYTLDGLHLTSYGYEIVTAELKKYI